MIGRLKKLLAGSGPMAGPDAGQAGLRLASAALLVEAGCMDGFLDADETAAIRALLIGQFDLNGADADALVEAGRDAVSRSSELYGFTKTIKDGLDHDGRVRMIEMLWEVAYADGILHDYESNLVRRVAGLLYVPDRESGAARKRVLVRSRNAPVTGITE